MKKLSFSSHKTDDIIRFSGVVKHFISDYYNHFFSKMEKVFVGLYNHLIIIQIINYNGIFIIHIIKSKFFFY